MYVPDYSYATSSAASGASRAGGGMGAGAMLGLAGKGLAAAGSIYAGISESKALKAQARAKDVEAGQVAERGVWEQIRMNEDARRLASTQRQLFGQAGVMLEGAPENLMRRSNQEFVMERMMHGRNVAAEVSALGTEADELRKAAKRAKTGGIINAFASFF